MFDSFEEPLGYHVPTFVLPSKLGGLGVFTRDPILKDDVVEKVPVTLLRVGDLLIYDQPSDKHHLAPYVFGWNNANPVRTEHIVAFAHGTGSIYNHSPSNNASFCRGLSLVNRSIQSPFYKRQGTIQNGVVGSLTFVATRDIAPGEEITISYFPLLNEDTLPAFEAIHGKYRNISGPLFPAEIASADDLMRAASFATPGQYGDERLEQLVKSVVEAPTTLWRNRVIEPWTHIPGFD